MATEYKSIESLHGGEEAEWFWNQVIDLIRQYHYNLGSASVQFMAVFAAKYTGKPPTLDYALKVKGLAIAAKAEVISVPNRICGMGDARLVIDRYSWDRMTPNQRRAMIDDCLESIEPLIDDEGVVVKDSADRPKIKIRPFDFCVSGFKAPLERHRANSMEAMQITRMCKVTGQLVFEFMADAKLSTQRRELFTEQLANAEHADA